jgi:hypothetical protein
VLPVIQMVTKRKPRGGNSKLARSWREWDEARLRERVGDETFELIRDEMLIYDFFCGQPLVDHERMVGVEFLKSGSAKELESMAALARMLDSVREFIEAKIPPDDPKFKFVPFALDGLAKMFGSSTSERRLVVRRVGREDRTRGLLIASAVASEVRAGAEGRDAWRSVGKRFGYSAKTVQRLWVKYKDKIVQCS